MQLPNLLFCGYAVVALGLLCWGWKCLSLEVAGRDEIFRWTTNFWLTLAMALFFLLGLAFPVLGWKENLPAFYTLYTMPFAFGLIVFNAGYWIHVLMNIVNCAPRVG